MRNLTIKRNKSFAGILKKSYVYIEDYACQDTVIRDVPCRKLGTLKNNEETTFVIGDTEAKVFVAGDRLSKGFWNDFYTIPAGVEDVYLSGKNHFNLLNDNAFLFDNVNDEDSLKNRKRGKKIGLFLLIFAAIFGFFIGFFSEYFESKGDPKTFALEEMRITLTDKFEMSEMPDYDFTLETDELVLFVTKEEFELLEEYGELTLEDYGNLVIENGGLTEVSELYQEGELYYFDYIYEDSIDIYYLNFVYESENAFWLVTFAISDFGSSDYMDYFFEWASSVSFVE